ncbi:uncharacterized protein LOC100369764 [Saccoglossus kowalevskii]|uniref:von Willebrand type d domain protein-like m2 n=1 Tax=Saccoglossus kowalevskii TaxID=10224 RepID=A0A0U2STG6_SACKO|nr:von Willebrand type d domain protein-like m2 [Saccoglossus kowalevskii]
MDSRLVILLVLLAVCSVVAAKKKKDSEENTDVATDEAADAAVEEAGSASKDKKEKEKKDSKENDGVAAEEAGSASKDKKEKEEKEHGKGSKEKKHGKGSKEKKHGKGSHEKKEKTKKGARKFKPSKKRLPLPDTVCNCAAWGDPHYINTKGTKIDFQGDCEYLLFKDNDPDHDNPLFIVTAKNQFRDEDDVVTLTEMVTVLLYDSEYDYYIEVKMFQNNVVRIDGIDTIPPIQINEHYSLDHYGKGVILISDYGFWMTWDFKNRAEMGAPAEYEGKLVGMCGNCDFTSDDLLMPDNSIAEDWVTFGNSWKTDSSCLDVTDTARPCTSEMELEHRADDQCGMIIDPNGPFNDCGLNDPDLVSSLYESCMFDMCYTKTNRDEALCDNLGTAYDECKLNGYTPGEFRTDTFCALRCQNYARYAEDAPACPNTCLNPLASTECPDDPTEGCSCIDNYLLSGDECVLPENCGAVDENYMYHKLDDRWVTEGCSEMCIVTGPETIECETFGCDIDEECEIKDGGYHCISSVEVRAAPDILSEEECNTVGGICSVSCANTPLGELAADNMLCITGLTCCIVQQSLCSKDHYGGFCDITCNDGLNSINDPELCEGFPTGYVCCKPIVERRIGLYFPEPAIVDGELGVEKPSPEDLPPDEELAAVGPPGEGAPAPENYVASEDTIGGIPVPSFGQHGDPTAAGEQGDPREKTHDGLRYTFIGDKDACDYYLLRSTNPSVDIITHHVPGTTAGEKATFVSKIYIEYEGVKFRLLQDNDVEINGVNVKDQISVESPTSFANGLVEIQWATPTRETLLLSFGSELAVVWRGHFNRVKVYTTLTGLSGLLGDNDGNSSNDLNYMKDGELVILDPKTVTEEQLREFEIANRVGPCGTTK